MEENRLGMKGTRLLLVVVTFSMFSTMVARLAISPVVPNIIDSFDVSSSAIGLALTGMWAAYSLTQFPSGILADRVGEYHVILAALALTSIASILVAISPSYILFVIFTIVLGAVAGLYFSPATSLLTAAFDETGQPLGIHSAGGPIAGLVAPIITAAITLRFDWRAGLLWTASVSFIAFILFKWYVTPVASPASTDQVREQVKLATLLELLSRPSIIYTSIIGTVGYFSWHAFATFFPTFLMEHGSIHPDTASTVFGLVFAFSIVGMPLLGRLSDSLSRESVLAFSMVCCAAGFSALLVGIEFWNLAVGAVGLSFGISWTGVLNARYMDIFDRQEQGTGFGLVRTVVGIVSSSGSLVTGLLIDYSGWNSAYGLVVVLLLGCVSLIAANKLAGWGW